VYLHVELILIKDIGCPLVEISKKLEALLINSVKVTVSALSDQKILFISL
jgi:hypothetical protein